MQKCAEVPESVLTESAESESSRTKSGAVFESVQFLVDDCRVYRMSLPALAKRTCRLDAGIKSQ